MINTVSALLGSTWRFAVVGALACVIATLVAELFLQATAQAQEANDEIAPLTIVLLIDVSGSMTGEPIVEVREASIHFIETWERANTSIALVPFSDTATLLRPILGPAQNPAGLVARVRTLAAGGGTNMVQAMVQAKEVFNSIDAPHNAILLFTDGLPNNPILALLQAEVLRREGAVIVAVGTIDADTGFLQTLTLQDPDRLFTTRLGEYAIAFELAAQAIATSAFGTASTSQGLLVVTIVALFLAAALLVAENAWGLRGHWWRDLWWMPPLGAALGFLGATVGENLIQMDVASWALVGLTSGVALGLLDLARSIPRGGSALAPRKALRGALFGFVGGTVGGVLFGLIFGNSDLRTAQGETIALVSRLSGFGLLGFFIGLTLKVGEELLKDVWLMGTSKGPYEGKQFILNKSEVKVGRAGNNDINLARETGLASTVGRFVQDQGQWFFQPAAGNRGETAILVNGAKALDRTPLSDNAAIHFGSTEFLFRTRGHQGQTALEQDWALVGDEVTLHLPRQGRVKIGNSPSCDVVLVDTSVLMHHCTLTFSRQGIRLKGAAGAYIAVNDQPLTDGASAVLRQGDLVTLGNVELGLIAA